MLKYNVGKNQEYSQIQEQKCAVYKWQGLRNSH